MQSLFRELRSHKLCTVVKKATKNKGKKGGYEGSEKLGCAPSMTRQASTSVLEGCNPSVAPCTPSSQEAEQGGRRCPLCAAGGV